MHAGELEVERHMAKLASRNVSAGSVPFFCGAGAYRHHVPASVDHLHPALGVPDELHALPARDRAGHACSICSNSRHRCCMLTGMEVANASMYDGSTGTAARP
jgi:glycine dehydrogenase subunit 1